MTVRDILKMGDPRLLRVAQPVQQWNTPQLLELLQDLRDTMQAANGAGLAAPQIGVDLQVVIFGSGQINPRYPDAPPVPPTVLTNPVLTPILAPILTPISAPIASAATQPVSNPFFQHNKPLAQAIPAQYAMKNVAFDLAFEAAACDVEDGWEGCLSVPGLRGSVSRFKMLRYQGFDERGNAIDRTVSGFHARVVQHECDHLHSILYPMRVKDFSRFGFTEVLFPELPADADD